MLLYSDYKQPELGRPGTLRNRVFSSVRASSTAMNTEQQLLGAAPASAAAFPQGRLCSEDKPPVVPAAAMKRCRDPGCAGAGGKRRALPQQQPEPISTACLRSHQSR